MTTFPSFPHTTLTLAQLQLVKNVEGVDVQCVHGSKTVTGVPRRLPDFELSFESFRELVEYLDVICREESYLSSLIPEIPLWLSDAYERYSVAGTEGQFVVFDGVIVK
jgi:hypothetical protein